MDGTDRCIDDDWCFDKLCDLDDGLGKVRREGKALARLGLSRANVGHDD